MKKFVLNGETLREIVYTTSNVVFQKIQEGNKRCYIIGNGHSLDVNNDGVVIKHDPAMYQFQSKISKDIAVYTFYFTFECTGLEETSREIAKFVDVLSKKYDEIFLVGHSKCGLCLYNVSHYCKCWNNITLVTISTPFCGTIIADKNAVEKRVKSRVLRKIYNMIFSDHNVDRDIIPNSQFIQSLQSVYCKEHINIISCLQGLSSCRDIMDLLLLFLDKIVQIHGDGVVPYNSQQINCTRTINIYCSHANSLKKGLEILEQI